MPSRARTNLGLSASSRSLTLPGTHRGIRSLEGARLLPCIRRPMILPVWPTDARPSHPTFTAADFPSRVEQPRGALSGVSAFHPRIPQRRTGLPMAPSEIVTSVQQAVGAATSRRAVFVRVALVRPNRPIRRGTRWVRIARYLGRLACRSRRAG